MKDFFSLLIGVFWIFFSLLTPLKIYPLVTDYLIDLGEEFFKRGDIYQAGVEFRKVLFIDSDNEKVEEYLEKIRKEKSERDLNLFSQKRVSEKKIFFKKEKRSEKEKTLTSRWELKSKCQVSLGITSQDTIWKKTNWDLNKKDWRLLSLQAYNRKANTFDPTIFNQLRFELDYPQKNGWGFHTNIDISPWSFIGKNDKITSRGVGTSDIAEVELKYWAWLDDWQEGHFNSGSGDFFEEFWDDSLSWFTRDSEGRHLTDLRGISLSWQVAEAFLGFSFASPKTLWQDYDEFDSYAGVVRRKYFAKDNFYRGIYKNKKDAGNQVVGVDFAYGLKKSLKIPAEVAKSKSSYDKTSSYKSSRRDWTAKIAIVGSSEDDVFKKNYFALSSKKKPFFKFRLQLTHMDKGFKAGLSSFRQTRRDTFWPRHIHFGESFKCHYTGYESTLKWEDVALFRIGDGVDYGRDVISLRVESENFLEKKLTWLFDIRSVHHSNGKYSETVTRLESTYRAIPKLATKFLGIYHYKPVTTKGVDSFYFNDNLKIKLDWTHNKLQICRVD